MKMTIEKVGINWTNHAGHYVLLADDKKEYRLPIYIEQHQATAIVLALAEINLPRPTTHDLLYTAFVETDVKLDHIEISSMSGSTFIGMLVAKRNGSTYNIDARPSDAIATAARNGCPILVAESVLDQAGITPEKETAIGVQSVSILWPFSTMFEC